MISFYKLKSKVISFFADIRLYWCGIILFGDSHYEIKGHHMREILDTVKPGDILLRRYSHYIGSVLVPGYFSHAAMYVGQDKVIHMLGKGICQEDILTFMRCDDILILRHPDKELSQDALVKAKNFLFSGVEYDYDFDTNSPSKFYCTEFVDNCFGYPVKNFLGGKRIMPDDFIKIGIFTEEWSKN